MEGLHCFVLHRVPFLPSDAPGSPSGLFRIKQNRSKWSRRQTSHSFLSATGQQQHEEDRLMRVGESQGYSVCIPLLEGDSPCLPPAELMHLGDAFVFTSLMLQLAFHLFTAFPRTTGNLGLRLLPRLSTSWIITPPMCRSPLTRRLRST